MTTTTRSLYAIARTKGGMNPPQALRAARIVEQFKKFERDGKVRMRAEPEMENYFAVYGEPEGYTDENGRNISPEDERKRIEEIIERDGCWWIVAEVLDGCPHCGRGEWEHADSIGICTGYKDPLSPWENWYVVDLMASAIEKAASS